MFCKACGESIEADSVFCRYCGVAQQQGVAAPTTEERIETCVVREERGQLIRSGGIFSGFDTCLWRFWGDAMGPEGPYNAGTSDWVKLKGNGYAEGMSSADEAIRRANLSAFMKKLALDGWDYVGKENYREVFRRRVRSTG